MLAIELSWRGEVVTHKERIFAGQPLRPSMNKS
jgi:hypothetical protein